MEDGHIRITMIVFRDYLRNNILKPKSRILEFGPLTRPIVNKETHPGIRFADIRSSEDIKKLYTSNNYLKSTGIQVDLDAIVDIDYVVKNSYKDSFKDVEKFDVVILSHVIEHMPDIIFFFNDVMNLLKPNGRLVIIYPDARYCFDHFRNGTTFVDAHDVYMNSENSSKRVFDFVFNVVHENDPSYFWNDKDQNKLLPKNSYIEALNAYDKAKLDELPDDTHFWPFADHQFIKFLYDMDRAGLLGLEIEEFYRTQENTQEFMIVLKNKKNKSINFQKFISILENIAPATNEISLRAEAEKLKKEILGLRNENNKLNSELGAVYSSKKWKYASNIASAKNKVTGKK